MLKTIATLFRATAAEAEEALFEANAIRLLEQRLREANTAFEGMKRDLAMVLAEETAASRAAAAAGERIVRLEGEARTALSEGRDEDALDIADRIASLEDERSGHDECRRRCAESAKRIRAGLDDNARLLGELRRGLVTARAAAAVARSRDRAARHRLVGEDAFREARATLERVRNRQVEEQDFSDALGRVERDLASRSAATTDVGLKPRTSAEAVLDRLRKKHDEPKAGSAQSQS